MRSSYFPAVAASALKIIFPVLSVGTPSDYDNDAVKTPNVYAIQYVLKEAAQVSDTDKTPKKHCQRSEKSYHKSPSPAG